MTLVERTATQWRNHTSSIDENISASIRQKKELVDTRSKIQDVNNEISKQNNVRKELIAVIERGNKMNFNVDKQKKELSELNIEIKDLENSLTPLHRDEEILKQSIAQTNIMVRQQAKEINAVEGSATKFSLTLGIMKKTYRDLNNEEKQSNWGQNLHRMIQEMDHEIKEFDKTLGNHQRNVGNYEGGFTAALSGIRGSFDSLLSGDIKGALSQFSEGIDGITQTVTYLTPAIKTATTATNAETASLLLNSTASTTAATASATLAGANATETASSTAVTAATNAETASLEANAVATTQAATASNAAAGGGMKQLLGSIKQLTVASLRFIATPLGAALMALVGIGLAAKAVWDYNSGLQESIKLTKQFTGLTGDAADVARQHAQALSDTYGTEFKTNIQAAQKLVQNFGISYEQAFAEIERGLARGGAANDEYFQSINEYPVFFAKAGYSASQFIDLINAGFSTGVYNDKLIDSIKEADISLREQTKTTRDALVNAFGASFSDDILKRIRTGQTSVKDALNEIADKANKTALTEQQLGQLTADVFRGAGEDVGGAAKMFEIMRKSVEEANRPLTQTEQHLQDLADANKELQTAMDDALKADGVINLQQSLELLWVKAKTAFFEVLKPIREFYEWGWKVLGRSESLANIWNSLQRISASLREQFDRSIQTFSKLAEQFGLNDGEANKFMKTIQILFDPVKQIEVLLGALADTLEFAGNVFETVTIYAEAFGRTIAEIQIGIENMDFSKLLNIRKTLLGNADDVIKKREEEKRKEEELDGYRDYFTDREKKRNDEWRVMQKTKQDEIIEQQKREAEAAKKREEMQKKFAAEEKKRQQEAKRLAEEAFREEISRNQALINHYKLTNESKLNFNESFTLQSIFDLRKYLDNVFDMEKKQAERIAGIKYEDALEIDINKRTSQQQNLINEIIGLEKWRADETKAIDEGLAKWKSDEDGKALEREKNRLAIDFAYFLTTSEDKKATEESYYNALDNLMLSHYAEKTGLNEKEVEDKYLQNQQLTELESEYLKLILEKRNEAREAEREVKQKDFESDVERTEYWLEYLGSSLGIEAEMREVFNAYKATLDKDDLKSKEDKAMSELALAAAVANAGAKIAGEQTVFGKALTVASVALNTTMAIMKAYADYGPVLGSVFAAVVGTIGAVQISKAMSTKVPEAPRFSGKPQFEHGVTNSTYEGLAIKDEAGAEIHLDKSGNVKDWGSNSGAKNFHIKKGDTILPNPISERIKDLMSHNPMPDLMMSLNLNGLLKQNNYDFERLEKKFDKLEKAIKTKENVSFVDAGEYLIEATKTNGSSHQRLIPKARIISNNQNILN